MSLTPNEKREEFCARKQMEVVPCPQGSGLKLTSAFHDRAPGLHKIAAKVADVFGNDTVRIWG